MRAVRVPTADDVVAASDVVARHLAPTPIVASPTLGDGVVLKLETMQPTGSFKVRGALAAVANAAPHGGKQLVTSSAGNHGLGVAYAATVYGARASIVVPETASAAKKAKLATFEVTLVEAGTTYDEAEAYGLSLATDECLFVSPYNDPDTIAGQGSIALELFAQVPDLRTIVVPIGGGGLIAGVGLAATLRPGVRVVGVDAAASPAVREAMRGNAPITIEPTLADGLAGNVEPGSVTVDLCRRYVHEIVSVTEPEIADGMRFLAREHGLVVEGSGAVGVAALLHGRIAPAGGASAVLLTGRNIALDVYARVIAGEAGEPRRR